MPIMSDQWITYQAQEKGLITPFVPRSMSTLEDGTRVSSYGLSSYGYDLRLNNSFKLFNFTNIPHELTTLQKYQVTYEHGLSEEIPNRYFFNSVIDPVNFDEDLSTLLTGVKTITVPPHGFLLAVSAEYIKLGRDFTGVCMEKSTLARCGLCCTVTPLEPEWEGYLTLEISNKTNLPIVLTAGMGICQLLFLQGNEPCLTSYKDRSGKYQNQPPQPVTAK